MRARARARGQALPQGQARAQGQARSQGRARVWVAVAVGVVLAAGAAVGSWWSVAGDSGPAVLELSDDLATHDPALVVGHDGQPWAVLSTGAEGDPAGPVQVRTSPDGHEWTSAGTLWDPEDEPAWVADLVPGVRNYWAPDVHEHDGTYYVYWAASTFGHNGSVIGLHTGTTLDPTDPDYGWTDQGLVLRSVVGGQDWNAIDPGIVEDASGTPWMAFGSYWGGIQIVELSWPSGKPVDPSAEPTTIASRGAPPNAIEAPYIVEHDGWYYLFVSKDACCRGVSSTYNIVVGRSRDVTGPYVDADGVPMLEDGGTPVLATDGSMIGPGGQSVSDGYLAYHYYDGDLGGAFQLGIRRLGWDADGWPVARVG